MYFVTPMEYSDSCRFDVGIPNVVTIQKSTVFPCLNFGSTLLVVFVSSEIACAFVSIDRLR